MKRSSGSLAIAGVLVFSALVAPSNSAFAQVTVFDDPIQFVLATGAVAAAIPASQTAFPGTSCGTGDIGPTGIGPQVEILFGQNKVTVTGVLGNPLCIFDAGTIIRPFGNTVPDTMIANTIVGNGEDDFLLVFDHPVRAVGFRFLTNQFNREHVTFKDEGNNIISAEDIDARTSANTRVFVGFVSQTPIKSVLIDTEGGATQNEGFDALTVGESIIVTIDIKPGSSENSINLGASGVIPVAILGSNTFDVRVIDPSTLSLAGGRVKTVAKGEKLLCHVKDVTGDRVPDLVCQFEVPTDLQPGDSIAILRGKTFEGIAIQGQDQIRIVPNK